MKRHCLMLLGALATAWLVNAEDLENASAYPIDLATVLQLAHARNLDIQIARERLAEARANQESTLWQFFPWISPGVSYRRHNDLIQDVGGNILDVDKESYAVGPTIAGQLDLGEVVYKRLAARQLVRAADEGLAAQRHDALLAASQAYFDLLKAHTAERIAEEAVSIATNYLDQIQRAVEGGIAFRGDALRVQVQAERNRAAVEQARQQQEVASAQLAQVLHLEQNLHLAPKEEDLLQITLVPSNTSRAVLVSKALAQRPEIRQSQALANAAREAKNGVVFGPLVPALSGQVFAGGFGGGRDGLPHRFGASEDYQVALGWRIGPGGLFDRSRVAASESRLRIAETTTDKLQDEIIRQVIEQHSRLQSLLQQLRIMQSAVTAAEQTLRLSRDRKEFAVGNVLETITAEQELTRSRLDLVNVMIEHNKTQYALIRSIGELEAKSQ